MNDSVMAVILTVLTVLELSSASPFGGKPTDTDVVQNRTRPWTDLFLRYPEYPVRRRVCSYKGDEYPDGAMVDTSEPCLKCRCLGGSLVCYLRVCPALPDPPPARCVLLLRRGACCSELICEDGSLTTNHISRAEPIGGDLPLETVSYGDGKGCIDNGTLYGSGSAMATSSLCEYCYCISGEQRCVRPHCLLPLSGCRPRRSPHSCCPVRYDCDYQPTTTTHAPSQIKGCNVDGVIHPEGEKVVGATQSPCDNCFCMRGSVRCVPLSCAPPLLGCTPIVLPGKCCASSYNCSQKLAEVKANNEILQVSESSRENIEREVIINERSFPDDTLLSPSQIATLLLNADGRINRRIGPDKKQNVTIVEDMVKSTESSTSTSTEKPKVLGTDEKNENGTISMSSTATTSGNITTENAKTSNASSPQKKVSLNESESGEVTSKVENITETIVLKKNSVNASETLNNNASSLNMESETKVSNKNSTPSVVVKTESNIDISKMIINDTVNCTTELSLIDTGANTTEPQNNADTLVTLSNYNDTEERRPYISGSIDAVGESDDEIIQHSDSDKDTTNKENDISSVGSQVPSTSLIIPKDDDIFMVNVSTFVRTNTSIVTLRPVAAIPPEIEALLNMSINKNNQKDDYFDYDYKSSLPPSLPNLEIIPFLAIDAVDKVKGQSAYGTAYPQVESKNYITSDNFSPTTYAPYTEDKYLSNPTSYAPKRPNNFNRNPVYKQHINDKFQATTYATIVNDNYENRQYAQDKYDATVYPSLTVEDSQTESPSFSFDVNKMNLFSPPSKTEGGFLPRDPPINSYYDLGYPASDDVSVTDGSLMVTNHAKTSTDDCVSNGRKYKNGELITESRACVVCFCYYGDIHCQDPECPAIKPGCRRKIEKGSLSCCGVEICNDETTTRSQTSPPLVDKIGKTTKSPINSIDRIDTADPFKDVIRTEPAPNLESLIGDMIPHYVRKTTVTTPAPQELTVTKIPTYVIPSKIIKTSASPTATTTKPSTFSVTTKKIYSPSQDNYIPDSNSKITQQYSTTEININRPTTTTPPPETTYSEVDQFSEDEEEEEFSFGSVLKLLLGDSSDVQTKPTTVRTTRRYTTQTTQASSSWRPSTPLFTRLDTTTPAPTTIRPTTSTVTYPTTTTYRNTYKYSFTKPIRTASPVLPFHKNNTKLGISATTRAPSVYPTVNRFTKPRRPFNSTPIPSTTQPVKNIAQPLLPPHEQHTSYKRKPILNAPADSSIPFGAGLLKLAGCNIYGRMYRVGKIITELSGPCLECMCTEIGVQCRAISC